MSGVAMKQALQPTAILALAILANTAQAQDDSTLSTVWRGCSEA
mgnify:CR=1 FL=1